MRSEEDSEEIIVGNEGGIKFDADDFGVAGITGADGFVGWAWRLAAGITWSDGFYAAETFKNGFAAPEAAGAEDGDFEG